MLKRRVCTLLIVWIAMLVVMPRLTVAQDVTDAERRIVEPGTSDGMTDSLSGDQPERIVLTSPPLMALHAAQATGSAARATPSKLTRREPIAALLLSGVWPGLGQAYNGPTEHRKGGLMALAHGGLWMMTTVGALNPLEKKETDIFGDTYIVSSHTNPLVWIGLLGIFGNSIYSMYDAAIRAGEINAANGLSLTPPGFRRHAVGLIVDPVLVPRGDLGVRAAVQMRF